MHPPQILIYKTADGKIKVDTLVKDETIWLSQKTMGELFDCTADNVALHIKNIYETGEISEKGTSEDFSVVGQEGNRQVTRNIKHYNHRYDYLCLISGKLYLWNSV